MMAALRRRMLPPRWVLLGVGLVVVLGGFGAWFFWPDPQLAAAEHAIEHRDYAGAYAHLRKCLERRPGDRLLLFLAARTARRAKYYDEAETHLRACQRFAGMADAVALERALIRAQQGDLEVEPYLKERVEKGDPDTLLIWEVLIQLYLDSYQLFKARDCLDLYLERRPDDVQALLGRGFIWDRLFYYAEAGRDYRRAVEVEPDSDFARLRLAETLLMTGPPEEAAEHFERLRQRHPDDPAPSLGLARAWRQQGRTEQARELLDRLLAEHPHHAGILSERGRVALDEGDTERAAAWLRQAVARAPSERTPLYNLYTCLLACGRDAEARECRDRLDRLDADLKRLAELTKIVLRTPADPAPRCEAAQLFLRNGEEQEGVRWLNMALRIAPGYRPAHQALADYYQRTDQPRPAAQHRRLAEGAGPAQPRPSPPDDTARRE